MTVNTVKNNFTGGELDPLLHTRADLPQWRNGARTMRNVEILAQGGFKRRRGTRFVEALLPVLSRLTADVTITAPNGGSGTGANDGVESNGLATTVAIGATNPYVALHYDLGSAKTIQFADVVGFSLSSGTADFSDWFVQYSTDNVAFTTLGEAVPIGNQTSGERTRRRTGPITARYWRLARIGATTYGSATANVREFNLWQLADPAVLSAHRRLSHDFSADQKYLLLATDRNIRVYKKVNGIPVRQADIRTAFTSEQLSLLNWTQSLDTLIAVHEDVRPHKIQRQGSDSQWNTELAFADLGSVNISDLTISDLAAAPADAFVSYTLTNTGVAQQTEDATTTEIPSEWHFPRRAIVAGEYQVRATLVSGPAVTGSAVGALLDLATSRAWVQEATSDGGEDNDSTLLIEIFDTPTGALLASATIRLHAVTSL